MDNNHEHSGQSGHGLSVLVIAQIRAHREPVAESLAQRGLQTATGHPDDLARLTRPASADLVLLDVAESGGVESIRELTSAANDVPVVTFGLRPVEADVIACVEAGVRGIVGGDESVDTLVEAIRNAVSDGAVFDAAIGRILLERVRETAEPRSSSVHDPLSKRETEILGLIERGMSNKEIASRLHLGLPTVKSHVQSILKKLGVRRRAEAAAWMRRAYGEDLH